MEVGIQPQLPRLLQGPVKTHREDRAQEPGWKGAKASRQWDMKEVMLPISATDQSLPLTTWAVGYWLMFPRETPGQGERGGPLPALSGPEISSPYCELESLL